MALSGNLWSTLLRPWRHPPINICCCCCDCRKETDIVMCLWGMLDAGRLSSRFNVFQCGNMALTLLHVVTPVTCVQLVDGTFS